MSGVNQIVRRNELKMYLQRSFRQDEWNYEMVGMKGESKTREREIKNWFLIPHPHLCLLCLLWNNNNFLPSDQIYPPPLPIPREMKNNFMLRQKHEEQNYYTSICIPLYCDENFEGEKFALIILPPSLSMSYLFFTLILLVSQEREKNYFSCSLSLSLLWPIIIFLKYM